MKDYYIDQKGNKRRFKFEAGDVVLTVKLDSNEVVPYLICFHYDNGYNFICLGCGQYDYVWDKNSKDEIKEILFGMNVIDVIKHKEFIKQFKIDGYDVNKCNLNKDDIIKFTKKNSTFANEKMKNRHNREITVSELFTKINMDECWNYFEERFNDGEVQYSTKEVLFEVINKFKVAKRIELDETIYINMYYHPDWKCCLCNDTSGYAVEGFSIGEVLDYRIEKSTSDAFPDYIIATSLIWEYTFGNWDNE